ncbi:hypothetical protein A1A1_15538 [Planococcus antarcticus DSM 14505]|uniref:Zinc-finger domain-containing protein n=1 Tax=Planococcus antarcticus DSM 14505 TaxID=1185653 RepID=A0A1C7DEL3_9BACL|nr:hypothetical protein [Planococcus antarcticus]ANU09663.1 hypothetical protein BBH88_04800 [Planococcus antarcticus DSM 14505]EIM05501.1 hypothetical protein A1A1_15538 [Planococcus antarcticus DSM 14505]
MEMECDLVVDCINGSLPFERKWEEVEKHLEACWECQELMESISELPYLVNARVFSSDMKARILAIVFQEEPDSISKNKFFHKRTARLSCVTVPFFTTLLRHVTKGSKLIFGKETIKG